MAREAQGDEFWFYQTTDARPVYLHPLCHRALLAEHGDVAALPTTLTARVVDVETRPMDERLRRKMRDLAHVPPTQVERRAWRGVARAARQFV